MIRPAVPADEAEVLDLLRASLGGGPSGDRTEAFFRWKHHQNPFGPSFSFVATDGDGSVVGFRTFMRWRWRTAVRSWEAVRAVDTATHPEHRGAGIFKRLTLHALDALAEQVDLVFNTPNDQSRPGYLKMGWTQVGTVPVAIRPVHRVRFAMSLVGRGAEAVEPIDCALPLAATAFEDPSGLADLLAAARPADDRLATDRSLEYLHWRYALAPGLDYRVITIGPAGRPDGIAFARPRIRGRLAELTLSEIVVADGDAGAIRAIGREAARRSGCDHVATMAGPDPAARSALRRAGYLSMPGKGMVLTSRPLGAVDPDPTVLGSWRFGLGDLEVF